MDVKMELTNKISYQKHHYKNNNNQFNLKQQDFFQSLDVLESIAIKLKKDTPVLNNYFLLAGQHILSTTGSLIQWMINTLSLPASNIYLIGKSYSNSMSVISSLNKLKINYYENSTQTTLGGFCESYDSDITLLWNKLFVRIYNSLSLSHDVGGIFVLDDGGHLLKKIPQNIINLCNTHKNAIPIIGIEQTSSGIAASKSFPFPVIELATSAAKQLEAPMVSSLIEKLLNEFLFKKFFDDLNYLNSLNNTDMSQLSYGIIGLGNIGSAILKLFKKNSYKKIIIFDHNDHKKEVFKHDNVYFASDVVDFVDKSDLILGCTGTDFMNNDHKTFIKCLDILHTPRKFAKILISLSSKDTEFNSLLKYIYQQNRTNNIIDNPIDNIIYPKENPAFIILNGGMPFNFMPVYTGLSEHSVPPQDIQLVRGLLVASILQAHDMMLNINNVKVQQYKLDPNWQSFIVNAWLKSTKRDKIPNFDNIDWIAQNSGGELYDVASSKIKCDDC